VSRRGRLRASAPLRDILTSFPCSRLRPHYPEGPASSVLTGNAPAPFVPSVPSCFPSSPRPTYNNPMPRTFSLAALLTTLTAIALLCGMAVNYPTESMVYGLLFAQLLPAGIVCLILFSLARRRKNLLVYSMLGGLILGTSFMPVEVFTLPRDPNQIWTYVVPEIIAMTIFPSLGAFLFGGIALLYDWSSNRSTPTDDRLDQDREIQRLLRR
jgi:hypothetical protein